MTRWIVDLNSFEVEADTHEEAVKQAEEILQKDVSLAYPMNVFKSEEDEE